MIVKPTRFEGDIEVSLNTKVSAVIFTNCPRIKYTPASTVTAEPVCAADEECVVADAEFDEYVDVEVLYPSGKIFRQSTYAFEVISEGG